LWKLNDRLSDASYQREGTSMIDEGLYLELGGWGCCCFEISDR
jgi:hypothetical protein